MTDFETGLSFGKLSLPFRMAMLNAERVHERFLEHLGMGTTRMEEDKEAKNWPIDLTWSLVSSPY